MEEMNGKWSNSASMSDELPSIKSIAYLLMFFLILAALISCILKIMPPKTLNETEISRTTLEICNESNEDSVLTYLTLGADTNFITDVNGIFGIKDSGLQGSFWMHKDSIYVYEFSKKGLSGNFSFNTVPLNCPTNIYPTGTNLFEVTLNNYGTVKEAQETIDISNVAGVNALGEFTLTGGGTWIAGGNEVTSFSNSTIYKNVDSVGVYPFGCDDCTASVNPPICTDTLKISEPQKSHICNVSRDAKKSGGKVRITFLGFTD